MFSWEERIRAAARPLPATDAVGPLLACLDAYAHALREHGFDARWMGQPGGDAVVVLYFSRGGREGAGLAFRILRDGLHEIRPGCTTWNTAEALEARLLHHATHTGAYAWFLAGHGMDRYFERPGTPKNTVHYVDGPLEPLEPFDLVPTRPAPAEAMKRRLVEAFAGLEQFSPGIDALLAVLDDVTAASPRDSGVDVCFMGPFPGNPDPTISGSMSSIVDPTHEISWSPLHFELGRTGLIPDRSYTSPVFTEPGALRTHFEQALSERGKGLAAELRLEERCPGTLRIGGHEVTLDPEARMSVWRALWTGGEAVGQFGTTDPDALLEAVRANPVVRLLRWGLWTLDPARCHRLSDDTVVLVGTGVPSFRRWPLFPGRVPSEPTAWSETLPARLGPVPADPMVVHWLHALCAAANTLPDVELRLGRTGGRDDLLVIRLWCPSGTASVRLLRSGEVLTNNTYDRPPPAVDEAGVLALAERLAGRITPGDAPRPDPKRRTPRTHRCSVEPERVAAALARGTIAPDPEVLAETVHLLETSAPLAAWWRRSPYDGKLELQIRSSDSGEHVASVVRLDRTAPSDPDALRAAILAQLEGGHARGALRKILYEREKTWVATRWCHHPAVWMARPVYQKLVASLLDELPGVRTTLVRMHEPERWVERILGWGPIPIAGVELSPTSVERHGEHELLLVGPVRFAAGRNVDE